MTDDTLTRSEYTYKQCCTTARDVRVEYSIDWPAHRIDVRMQSRGGTDLLNPDVLIQLIKHVLPEIGITAYAADVEVSQSPVSTPWAIVLAFACLELRVRAVRQLDGGIVVEILPPAG